MQRVVKLSDQSNTDLLKANDWSLDFLCDYIETNHHNYTRKMMPKILNLCKNLSRDNEAAKHLLKELTQLNNELENHMHKEEKLLFKYIKKLYTILNEEIEYEIPPFGSISNLIKVMEKEHLNTLSIFNKAKAECSDFKIREVDNSTKAKLYSHLSEFNTNLQFHMYIEHKILYPKSISLEKKIKKIFF